MINEKNIPWCEKYRALCFSDIKGQDIAILKLKNFLKQFPRKKILILYGPSGVGKTSLAYALSIELDAEVIEINSSNILDKEKINLIIGNATKQVSLFKKTKIILVDDLDSIVFEDNKSLAELIAIAEKSTFPIIMTAKDIWNKKFTLLRKEAELIELKSLDYKSILEILKKICEKESCIFSNDLLTSIAIRSKGDVRAAINDLQAISQLKEEDLSKELHERNKEESIFNVLKVIFQTSKIDDKMINIFDEVDMNIDELFLWIEENIPLEYNGEEIAKAFDALSKADVYRGRIHRQQHWRFLVYENFFIGSGVAAAKKYNRDKWISYRKPSRILKIWLQNQRNLKKKSICEKYAKATHMSIKEAMKNFLLIKMILKNEKIRKELNLDKEEIEYLDKPLLS